MPKTAKPPADSAAILAAGYHTTPLGSFWSQWTAQGLFRIEWNAPQQVAMGGIDPQAEKRLEERVAHFDTVLNAYFAGQFDALNTVEIDPVGWTPFYREVYRACRAIPAGQTLSYGALAERAGRPAAARAVGQAMATNRVMWIIPCHRVVASSGRLHHYGGPGGVTMKRWLLDHERAKVQP
ncbi:methylated-DNA--[protein]-cysteine S-methyltransferase [Candidatus Laterigemmans baculatus]|uniref:methylated-DNA--[protein]-cysteine S-methyltransferase n=1 Tax=Candidatus Laterigemmans baculatus TaxID=2770505 RepID=UPI0013DC5224|nr:methylated-DNA--[protein]-cysteine S-methyltransferase [Candidatus Laterigemmans baculatus]